MAPMSEIALNVVGSVVLDLVRHASDDSKREVGFGGVCFNAAIAASHETTDVRFISTSYLGDIHRVVELLLAEQGISWHPLSAVAPVPLFEAFIGDDDEVTERFEGALAYDRIDPEQVAASATNGAALLTCNDLSPTQLDTLFPAFSIAFLLSSSLETAPQLTELKHLPDYLALNLSELESAVGAELRTMEDVARASQGLVNETGYALVTLGAEGALLSSAERKAYLLQPAFASSTSDHWIGAGDAVFGAFAGALVAGLDVELALAHGLASARYFTSRLSRPSREEHMRAISKLRELASDWESSS
jgi:sugar/nucleoside kinase (ribokinase family)